MTDDYEIVIPFELRHKWVRAVPHCEPVTRRSFIEAFVDAYPSSPGYEARYQWAKLHTRTVLGDEIDEDPPAPAPAGQPSPYSGGKP